MRSYIEWINTNGFFVRESWDVEKRKMVHGGKLLLAPHQTTIMERALGKNAEDELQYKTVLYSAPKKSGKSTIAASVAAWYAEEAPDGTEIYILANSLEHAEGRVMADVKYHVERAIPGAKIINYRIEYPNGTFIQALGQAYKSAAGSRHSLTVYDELWGYSTENDIRMWDEMTPIPTAINSLRFVATYAGFRHESHLLWDLYLTGVGKELESKGRGTLVENMDGLPCWENGSQFTYWDSEHRMPWQTSEYYLDQQKTLRPAAYLRLHQNQWVTTHEEFIPIEWFDDAAKLYRGNIFEWEDHPFRGLPLYVAVDVGLKRDCTAIVGVGYDSHRVKLGIAFHKIWTPVPGQWFDLDETVEKYLREVYNRNNIAMIVYDRTQLHQTMVRLRAGSVPVKEFPQSSEKLIAASQSLFDLFRDKKIEAYQDEELRKHLEMARAEVTPKGFRIRKSRTDKKFQQPDDAAVALAMATYEAILGGGVDVTVPIVIQSPFSSEMEVNEELIPWQLRS